MKQFFYKHEEWLLGISGVILAASIISLTVWSVGELSTDLAKALTSGRDNQVKVDFNIEQLSGMNLRGLSEAGL